MSRPLTAPQAAELAKVATTSGECLVLVARDGTRARFTTLDVAQAIDLGLGAGSETCSDSMRLSAGTLATGLEASFVEVRGPLGPVLTRAAIEGGKWKDAEAFLLALWPGVAGWSPLLRGKVRECRAEDPEWVIEIRNQVDSLAQPLEWPITAYCHWRFGSTECGHTPVETAATVTTAPDAMRLTVAYSGSHADQFFQFGEAEFTGGALAGVISEALFSFNETAPGAGTIELAEPLAAVPAVGDPLILREGCAKTRPVCVVKQGNARRFGGEPDVPGSEKIWQFPNPGGGG